MGSADLQWLCIRNNSAFLRKKAGVTFNAEPGHLTGLNAFSTSTLVGKNTLAVKVQQEKNSAKQTVIVCHRNAGAKGQRKPKRALVKTGLNKNAKKGLKSVEATINKGFNRRDLQKRAVAMYQRVLASFKTKVQKRHISPSEGVKWTTLN